MKVKDIRNDDIMVKCHELSRIDLEEILAKSDEFVEVDCPACAEEDYTIEFEKDGFKFNKCVECDTLYISPRPTPKLLEEYYTNSRKMKFWNEEIFPLSEETRKERIFRPRKDYVINIAHNHIMDSAKEGFTFKDNNLVDIGAGFGTFCELNLKHSKINDTYFSFFNRVIALEPSKGLAKTCRERGIETIESMVEDFKPDFPVSVLTCFELIEHVFDPFKFVKDCHKVLSENGLLIMTTPNIAGFETQTLWDKSTTIGGPGHLNYFSVDSITKMLTYAGYKVLSVETNGELDADLVHREMIKNKDLLKSKLFDTILNDEELKEEFQEFLKTFNLSSNMTIVAQKIKWRKNVYTYFI